jgi:hypothetical protein
MAATDDELALPDQRDRADFLESAPLDDPPRSCPIPQVTHEQG